MDDPGSHHLFDGETSFSEADAMATSLSPSVSGPSSRKVTIEETSLASLSSQYPPPTLPLTSENVVAADGEAGCPLLRRALHAPVALAKVASGAEALPTNYAAAIQVADSTQQGRTETSNAAATTSVHTLSLTSPTIPSEGKRTKISRQASLKSKVKTPIAPLPIAPSHSSFTTSNIHPGVGLGGISPVGFLVPPPVLGSEGPPFFRGNPQRSGKWTREEEQYVELLIELFEKGHIEERNGSTLRSYLSRKLHCAPMRISKKYAGKGIGKMVFLSKSSFRDMGDGIGSPAYHRNMQRLQKAESAFYKSCVPDLVEHIVTAPNVHATGTAQAHLSYLPPPNMMQPVHPPIISTTGLIQSNGPLPNLIPGSFVVPQPKFYATAGTFKPTFPSHCWVPPPREAAVSGTVSTALSAVALTENSIVVGPLAPQIQLTARQSLEQAYADVGKTIEKENTIEADAIVPPAPANNAAQNVAGVPNQPRCSPANYSETNGISCSSTKDILSVQQAMDEMPDFLSGFDRAAGQANSSNNTRAMDSEQFSPGFTSRSFDDFHCLLGKSLSPVVKRQRKEALNLPPSPTNIKASSRPRVVVSPSTVRLGNLMDSSGDLASAPYDSACFKGPWPTSTHTTMSGQKEVPDACNIFAQQSAFAASQHSTYTSGLCDDGLPLFFGCDDGLPLFFGYDDGLQLFFCDKIKMSMPSKQPLLPTAYSSNRNSSRINPALLVSRDMSNTGFSIHNFVSLSDRSGTSDQWSDEIQVDTSGSGTDNQADGSSNYSDGANSESTHKRRRIDSHHISYHGIPLFADQQHSEQSSYCFDSFDNNIGEDFRWTSERDNRDS